MDAPFLPIDDRYHLLSDDHYETETNWWSANVPERGLGIWLHAALMPNRRTVDWKVFAWDANGSTPGQVAYYRKVSGAPMEGADLTDIEYPDGGYRLRMLTPLTQYELAYDDTDAGFALELRFDGSHAPRRFPSGRPPMLGNVHLDQLGHVTGSVTLRGERIAVDCYSLRDRTWGPRKGHHSHGDSGSPDVVHDVRHPGGPQWREIERQRGWGRIQYIFGHVDDRTGFMGFARVPEGTDTGWAPLTVGWLLQDGVFESLDAVHSMMKVFRDPRTGWTSHIEAVVADTAGRRMGVEGHAVSWISESQTGANALMRWDMDGRIGWGEDQDGWRPAHWRRMLGALRAL